MIQSMTGYAEKKFVYKTFSVKITIKSLNHRFFDWNCRGSQITEIENQLRSLAQKRLHRGRLDAHVDLQFSDATRWELQINEGLLSKILLSLDNVSSRMQKDVTFSIDNVFLIPHVAELRRKNFSEDEIGFLERCFLSTLEDLIRLRRREGRQLKNEILIHIREVRRSVKTIERLGKKQPAVIRQKLKERLKELGSGTPVSEEKFLEETAYIAQRYDLTEEIERMKSHLSFVYELLGSKDPQPIGKKLDFVAQELLREANTINSKAQDISIIRESLTVKAELESIRQQVQNLE